MVVSLVLIICMYFFFLFFQKVTSASSIYYRSSVTILSFALFLFIYNDFYIDQRFNDLLLNGINNIGGNISEIIISSSRIIIFWISISSILCFVSSLIELKSNRETKKAIIYISLILSLIFFIFCLFFIVSGMGWTL
jgi:hypothetical protein